MLMVKDVQEIFYKDVIKAESYQDGFSKMAFAVDHFEHQ